MAWNLTGSYVETCSCELMCPCNLSFDHGATYDFCRVTLVFNIREGQVEGTDIGGLKVAAIADTPKVMTEGNWIDHDGVRHSVRVGDAIDFEIEDIVPFGVEDGHTVTLDGVFYPVAPDMTVAEARRSQISAFGIEYEGKTGLSHANFSWAA